jgi:hypothetical protein
MIDGIDRSRRRRRLPGKKANGSTGNRSSSSSVEAI